MGKTADIYVLRDPVTYEIRYVGKANDSLARFKTHVRDARRRRTPLYDWFWTLDEPPYLQVIFRVPHDQWEELERRTIKQMRMMGVRLLNVADGGNEPRCNRQTLVSNGRATSTKVHHGNPAAKKAWRRAHMLGIHRHFQDKANADR